MFRQKRYLSERRIGSRLVEDTMDATDFAEIFYKEVECRSGPPLGVVSDRDSRITSQFWADVSKEDCPQHFTHKQTDNLKS